MSTLPRRAIVASHLLSESIWVYALGAAIGAMSGNGRGPLAWWTVACLLTASYLVMRFLQLVHLPTMLARWTNALIAGLAVYAAIGAQFPESAVDFTWAFHLAGNDDPQSFDFIAIVGGLLGAGLWWRGGSLTLAEPPIESLELSFKLGLLALAIAAGVDMLASDDMNILPLMFIFFAASLTGLSIGNLRAPTTEASRERRWVRTIGAVVGGVLGAGLVFAILGRFVLSWLSAPAVWLLGLLSNAVFYVIILPLAYVFGYIASAVLAVLQWLLGEPEFEGQQEGGEVGNRLQELQELEKEAPGYLTYVEWTVIALVVLAALFFLWVGPSGEGWCGSKRTRRRFANRWPRMRTLRPISPASSTDWCLIGSRGRGPRRALGSPKATPTSPTCSGYTSACCRGPKRAVCRNPRGRRPGSTKTRWQASSHGTWSTARRRRSTGHATVTRPLPESR